MAGSISFGGIATGIDTASIVSQLMAIERRPETVMQTRSTKLQGQVNTFNQISSLLSSLGSLVDGFKTFSTLAGRSVVNSDASVATITADSTTATGSHSLKVTSLAQDQVQVSQGYASSSSLSFNTGVIKIDPGTASEKTITVAAGQNSLAGISALISQSGAAVNSSVVNTGSGATPYVLSVRGTDSSDHVIDFSGLVTPPQIGPDANPVLAQKVPSSKAEFVLDGVSMTRSTNTFSDAISGVTIHLLKADADVPPTADFTVSYDTAAVTAKINSFVGKYNEVINLLQKQSAYDATTKLTGTLSGDSTVKMLQRDMQSLLSSTVSGLTGYTSLAGLGMRTDQKTGNVSVDADKLATALKGDFDGVVKMLTANSGVTGQPAASYGILDRFSSLVARYTKAYQGPTSTANGIIATKVNGLTGTISSIARQIDVLEARLAIKEAAYKKTYSSLETLVANINSTGSSMLSTLNRL